MPRIDERKQGRVIGKQRRVAERHRERVNDSAHEQHRVPGLNHDQAKFPPLFGIWQVMRRPDASREHKQPIRELVDVKRKVLGAGREPEVHEAASAAVAWLPGTTLHARIGFEARFSTDASRSPMLQDEFSTQSSAGRHVEPLLARSRTATGSSSYGYWPVVILPPKRTPNRICRSIGRKLLINEVFREANMGHLSMGVGQPRG